MSHLTREQRYTISAMLQQGYSRTSIAKAIGKDKSVVSRELRRNEATAGTYDCDLAQRQYEERMRTKRKRVRMTEEMRQIVEIGLEQDFSPQQIVGRCRLKGVEIVSHERIYQYVWADKKSGGFLHEHLRRKGRKYRKRGAAKDSRGVLRDRVSIDQRPTVVDQKIRFGDLEIDTIVGSNHKGAILTINDRLTSFCWIELLKGRNAKELADAAVRRLLPLKEHIRTITSDNGKEFAEHKNIAEKLGVDFFFAHPYHSWERGANENTNGLIRQYIPKGSSFENLTDDYIRLIERKLNNRPREKLGVLTPNERLFSIFAAIN